MEAVAAGMGATVQPWSAVGMYRDAAERFQWSQIADDSVRRKAALCSLSDDELSPPRWPRVVLMDCAPTGALQLGRRHPEHLTPVATQILLPMAGHKSLCWTAWRVAAAMGRCTAPAPLDLIYNIAVAPRDHLDISPRRGASAAWRRSCHGAGPLDVMCASGQPAKTKVHL
jgi:hypothetical protein